MTGRARGAWSRAEEVMESELVQRAAQQILEVLMQRVIIDPGTHHTHELPPLCHAIFELRVFLLFSAIASLGELKAQSDKVNMREVIGSGLEAFHGSLMRPLRSPSQMISVHAAASTLSVQNINPSCDWRGVSNPMR